MRYVKKISVPHFFIEDTKELITWEQYYSNKKRTLKKYILDNEQNYLCIYCESKVSLDTSHLEHIKPKNSSMYPELTFKYGNLTVSCNGTCHNEQNDTTPHSCGHKKDNEYDVHKFLNPTTITDIRNYFIYDYDNDDNVEIKVSDKDTIKAQYMIDILKLNDEVLPKARKIALKNFINKMKQITDIKKRKERIKKVLSREDIAFISFLKYKYRNILV